MIEPEIVKGDILNQNVEVIVNSWNRNIIPWRLLLPQGVSGAIKKRAGNEPFKELSKHGSIPLGEAVLTNPGKLGYKGIIHVAGINIFWIATKKSIQKSVHSAMTIVNQNNFKSVAFPIIGSGSGNRNKIIALQYMIEAFKSIESSARVIIVEYNPAAN